VIMFDLLELVVCSYDLQVGMWPNLSKTHQKYILVSGDILIDYFQFIFQLKPFFLCFLLYKPQNPIPCRRVCVFKTIVYQNTRNKTTLCVYSFIFTNIFYKSIFTMVSYFQK
jgi:hypothetical protein